MRYKSICDMQVAQFEEERDEFQTEYQRRVKDLETQLQLAIAEKEELGVQISKQQDTCASQTPLTKQVWA